MRSHQERRAAEPPGIGATSRAWWLAPLLVCLLLAGCASGGGAESVTTPRHIVPTATPTPTPPPKPPPSNLALPAAPALQASAAILVDPQRQLVLYARNADHEQPMASTTKIMAAYVALTFGSLDQRITIGADAAAMINGINSVAGVVRGETLTLRELLYCLMLPSGDDAAVAIADGVAGSQERFVALMNFEAKVMGLAHTRYTNPDGLDDSNHHHYTTARDLAVLTARAMSLKTFREIVSAAHITLPATATHHQYDLTNTNKLLNVYSYPGVVGIKTGSTPAAGECLVFMANRPSGSLLGVVLGDPYDEARYSDARALLDWGFGFQQAITRVAQLGR
ncbi:MAG TPA: D-alanyl-D-alanine carboxypeptidase [Ktedonobacterales bacterium]